MNSSLTAFNLMRTDKAGMGGAIINMVAMSPTCPHPDMPLCSATRSMDMILSSTLGLDVSRLISFWSLLIRCFC